MSAYRGSAPNRQIDFYGVGRRPSTQPTPGTSRNAFPSIMSTMTNRRQVWSASHPTGASVPQQETVKFPSWTGGLSDIRIPTAENETSAGMSTGNETIMSALVFHPGYENERASRLKEMQQYRFVFVGSYGEDPPAFPTFTIQQLNQQIRENYLIGLELLKQGAENGIEGGPSKEEMQKLRDTPTKHWFQLEFFKKGILENPVLSSLAYLSADWILQMFKPFGILLGTLPEAPSKAMAVGVKGFIERAENIWGPDIEKGMDLYIKLAMYKNKKTGQHYLQFIPFGQFGALSSSMRKYKDMTGTETKAVVFYIGLFMREARNAPVSNCNYEIDAGLENHPRGNAGYTQLSNSAIVMNYGYIRGTRTRLLP